MSVVCIGVIQTQTWVGSLRVGTWYTIPTIGPTTKHLIGGMTADVFAANRGHALAAVHSKEAIGGQRAVVSIAIALASLTVAYVFPSFIVQ